MWKMHKNNKDKIKESKRVLDKKGSQKKEHNITITSAEEFTKKSSKDEKKKGKEWIECQGKLINLTINNDQLSIDMKKQEVSTLKQIR